MLPRVLESEAMDTPEDARDYDLMNHAEVNTRFVADFLRAHGPCRGGEILDVGTGPGQIPMVLCQTDPLARVLGIDLAESMLTRARAKIETAGLSRRVRLAPGDAKDLDLADRAFEGVISNTIVHHLPDPVPALREMLRLVAPGGTLMIRDLYRPDDRETLQALVETHATGESPSARALFEASLNAALTLQEIRDMVRDLGQPADGVTMTSDRHWTWLWHSPA
ncbi:MAG: class I SAM-dependent methyltransferase [Isosphaeraceae bacterium]